MLDEKKILKMIEDYETLYKNQNSNLLDSKKIATSSVTKITENYGKLDLLKRLRREIESGQYDE